MPKCFITKLEIPKSNSYLLDIKVARKAVFDLRKRVSAIEGILDQLAVIDQQEVYSPAKKKKKIRHERRLVCSTIATLFSDSYPEAALFMSWKEYCERKNAYSAKKITQKGADAQ